MKAIQLLSIVIIGCSFLFIQAQKVQKPNSKRKKNADTVVVYTTDVRAIIDQKCLGCHNPESKNEKAKKKFTFDELPKNAKAKQAKVMNDMLEVLSEGSMPPEKFLSFKPEAKLTEAEVKTLTAWAEDNAKNLNKK